MHKLCCWAWTESWSSWVWDIVFGSSLGEGSLLWSEGNHHCFIFPPFVPVTSSWGKVSGEVIYSCSEAASHPLTLGVLPLACELRSPHGLWPARLLCPCESPGEDAGVGCHFLLQGIFPTQGLNSSHLHCEQILYSLSQEGALCLKSNGQ